MFTETYRYDEGINPGDEKSLITKQQEASKALITEHLK